MSVNYKIYRFYEESPIFVRQIIGRVSKLVPLSMRFGKTFSQSFHKLEIVNKLSENEKEKLQLLELKKTLIMAEENVPYYKKLFSKINFQPEKIKSVEELNKLPLLKREKVQELGLDLVPLNTPKSSYRYLTTGGTSGKPLGFYITYDASAIEWAFMLRNWGFAGFKIGDKRAVLRGRLIASDKGKHWELDPVNQAIYFSSFHMDSVNLEKYVEIMQSYKPDFLHAYPSSALILAQYLGRTKKEIPSIRGLLLGSENLYASQKKYLEAVFGCRVYSWYGHSEKSILAGACNLDNGYYPFPLYGVTEIVDSDGSPITELGKRGLLVGTGFINRGTVFIRYLTDDEAEWGIDKSLGYPRKIIKNIVGRWDQEMLIGKTDMKVSMTSINLHDEVYTRMKQFQFFQDQKGKVVLKIIPVEDWNEKDQQKVLQEFSYRLSNEFELEIEYVSELSLTKTGKFKFVDQRLPISQ